MFKVADKMFALCQFAERPLRVSLKCEPALAEQLRQMHSAIAPGYHLNKRHWNTVTIDASLPDPMIGDMIEDSYDLVVSRLPKARQAALGWHATNASSTREAPLLAPPSRRNHGGGRPASEGGDREPLLAVSSHAPGSGDHLLPSG